MKKNTKLIIMDLYGIISLGSYWDVTNWLGKKFYIDPKKKYPKLNHKDFKRAHFAHTKRQVGLRKYFKHITNTFDLGLPKSSKKTILWVMKEFKVKPDEIVFCDDQAFNLVEAKK